MTSCDLPWPLKDVHLHRVSIRVNFHQNRKKKWCIRTYVLNNKDIGFLKVDFLFRDKIMHVIVAVLKIKPHSCSELKDMTTMGEIGRSITRKNKTVHLCQLTSYECFYNVFIIIFPYSLLKYTHVPTFSTTILCALTIIQI